MTEPPAMKKRQAGGSFCAMGGCSNRSTRDVMSSHPAEILFVISSCPRISQPESSGSSA